MDAGTNNQAQESDMLCSNCQNTTPKTRLDVAGNVVEQCTDPVHADFIQTGSADVGYIAAFRAKRETELAAAKRAPKTKSIERIYWELDASEYDHALNVVGLAR